MVEQRKTKQVVRLYYTGNGIKRFSLQKWYPNKASIIEDYIVRDDSTCFRGTYIPCILMPDMNSVDNTIDRFMKVLVLK